MKPVSKAEIPRLPPETVVKITVEGQWVEGEQWVKLFTIDGSFGVVVQVITTYHSCLPDQVKLRWVDVEAESSATAETAH